MSSTLLNVSNLSGDLPASGLPLPKASLTPTNYGHILASASNITWSLKPSPKDLWLAIPRMVAQVGSFALDHMPGPIDNLLRPRNAGSVIAEATGNGMKNVASAAFSGITVAQETATTIMATTEGTQPEKSLFSQSFSFQHLRNLGGIFAYLTSKWALSCFAVVSMKHIPDHLGLLPLHNN